MQKGKANFVVDSKNRFSISSFITSANFEPFLFWVVEEGRGRGGGRIKMKNV